MDIPPIPKETSLPHIRMETITEFDTFSLNVAKGVTYKQDTLTLPYTWSHHGVLNFIERMSSYILVFFMFILFTNKE